jgi:3-hydroxybutyryl-CoA dehydrogenase
VLTLVEVVRSIMTSDAVLNEAKAFVGELGKEAIDSQDRAGFVVNALLVPYLLSAIRMYESGFASKEDIDRGMVLGCAHPMGPLALSDLIGLDTLQSVAESMHDEFHDPSGVSPPLLNRMVEAGLLGRKAGRGFYNYDGDGAQSAG